MEDDYENLSLRERWTHKLWKARLSAYKEASKLFSVSESESDSCFKPFLSQPELIRKAVADSNVVAQEAGIQCLLDFLEFCGREACIKTRPYTLTCLVENALSSARANTKTKACQALSLMNELDSPDAVMSELLEVGLALKSPRALQTVIFTIREQFRLFGTNVISPKQTLRELPRLFQNADSGVRAEALELTVELYRWLSDGIKQHLFADLKSTQIQALEKAFDGAKREGNRKPERILKLQQRMEHAEQDAETSDILESSFDLVESVGVLKKLPMDLESRLDSSSWKDRKECLDEVFGIVNVPKAVESDDYTYLFRALAKSLKDANIVCVLTSASCIEALAKALGKEIYKYKSILISPLLEKYKEKKQNVVEALSKACDSLFSQSNIYEDLEEVTNFCKHKNPQIRTETIRLLTRSIANTNNFPTKNEQALVSETGVLLLGDTFEPVRTAAAEMLGTMRKLIGERAMTQYLQQIDDIRRQKILEFYEAAQVKAKPPKSNAQPTTLKKATPSRSKATTFTPRKSMISAFKPQNRSIKSPEIKDRAPISLTGRSLQKPQTQTPTKEVKILSAATCNHSEDLEKRLLNLTKNHTDLDEKVQSLQKQICDLKEDSIGLKIQLRIKDTKLSEAFARISELEKKLGENSVPKADPITPRAISDIKNPLKELAKEPAKEPVNKFSSSATNFDDIQQKFDALRDKIEFMKLSTKVE